MSVTIGDDDTAPFDTPPTDAAANHLPAKLVKQCIEVTTRRGGAVLDPFAEAGTVPSVCEQIRRRWIGIYIESVPPAEAVAIAASLWEDCAVDR